MTDVGLMPDLDDHAAWRAIPPPVELGPAIAAINTTIVNLTDHQTAMVRARCTELVRANPDRAYRLMRKLDEVLHPDGPGQHPIAESVGCVGSVTTVKPWMDAAYNLAGEGAELVFRAVAARDHGLISDGLFRTCVGWWVELGLPVPDRISDRDLAVLHAWWGEHGMRVPNDARRPAM
ncbi:hypothetical protein GCM10011608_10600 [Micromonospora sonchi]|uniref:Uncharacterized protein n=1 Tax=Micromonospora sonchi TaxID=1763543 RepID=A0A917TLK0_9ACTN|nr:hypothetical protein [Micromonospora sonchi]GGM27658.1 hypothetical protein GCM10011608_10600 [Micromonospora sonchi]